MENGLPAEKEANGIERNNKKRNKKSGFFLFKFIAV